MTILSASKIWWLDFTYSVKDGVSFLDRVDACRVDGKRSFTTEGGSALPDALTQLTNEGAVFVFTWDFSLFGAFLDTYALQTGMKIYDEVEKRQNTRRKRYPTEPCFSAFYTVSHGVMNARFTLRRTAYTHGFRSGKLGGLHTVEYRGLSVFFPGRTREEVEAYFGSEADTPVARGAELLEAFFKKFSEVVDEDVCSNVYLRKVYTLGGAARRSYLRIRYGDHATLAMYQKEHFTTHRADDYFRERRLQLGGAIFFPQKKRGKLIKKHLIHYDINALYSETANRCGELTFPRNCDWKDFQTDRDPHHTYIIVVKDFVAYRKPALPAAFMDPVGHSDGNVISIKGEWALFRELWEALKLYYDFEEFDIVKILRCDIKNDPSMVAYNARYDGIKERARAEDDGITSALAKGMLNNIIGKMTQRTVYGTLKPEYNEERNMVEFKRGKLIDRWADRHFDYIRGAYIYTCARVRIMTDIYHWLGKCPVAHHFYTDTDCIVTDVKLPPDMVDALRIGYYKIEREYTHFGVIAKKVYYGRTTDGKDHVTCAGIKKGTVMREIYETYGEQISPSDIWRIIIAGTKFPMRREVRMSGGAFMEDFLIGLDEIDIDKMEV